MELTLPYRLLSGSIVYTFKFTLLQEPFSSGLITRVWQTCQEGGAQGGQATPPRHFHSLHQTWESVRLGNNQQLFQLNNLKPCLLAVQNIQEDDEIVCSSFRAQDGMEEGKWTREEVKCSSQLLFTACCSTMGLRLIPELGVLTYWTLIPSQLEKDEF